VGYLANFKLEGTPVRTFIAIAAVGLALGAAVLSGCTVPCHPSNCEGCCTSTGVCSRGVDQTSCGSSGNSCDVCSNIQTCSVTAGKCAPAGSGGGSGGSGGSGGGGGSGGAGGGSATYKRIFITSAGYSGNLAAAGGKTTGLEGADALCNTAATAAALGGTWKAWISDGTTRAIDRITATGPWKKLDSGNTTVFNNKANLQTQPLSTIDYNENGVLTGGSVWTGTATGGAPTTSYCSGWASSSSSYYGTYGQVAIISAWTDSSTGNCSNDNHLYCLEM
jgi:hypothetical protein